MRFYNNHVGSERVIIGKPVLRALPEDIENSFSKTIYIF